MLTNKVLPFHCYPFCDCDLTRYFGTGYRTRTDTHYAGDFKSPGSTYSPKPA